MRTTTDTITGKPFKWNDIVVCIKDDGTRLNVPARITSRTATHLHPTRVRPELLAALNA